MLWASSFRWILNVSGCSHDGGVIGSEASGAGLEWLGSWPRDNDPITLSLIRIMGINAMVASCDRVGADSVPEHININELPILVEIIDDEKKPVKSDGLEDGAEEASDRSSRLDGS